MFLSFPFAQYVGTMERENWELKVEGIQFRVHSVQVVIREAHWEQGVRTELLILLNVQSTISQAAGKIHTRIGHQSFMKHLTELQKFACKCPAVLAGGSCRCRTTSCAQLGKLCLLLTVKIRSPFKQDNPSILSFGLPYCNYSSKQSIVQETFIINSVTVCNCQIDRILNGVVKELLTLSERGYLEDLASGHTWSFIKLIEWDYSP